MAELMMLRLEGPMQSWGDSSVFDNRGTSLIPAKSAIIGLLACALGLPRDSGEIPALSAAVELGVRADRAGTYAVDFQTVQGMPKLYTADGKPRSGNTIVSPHGYLQDASFLVVLQAEEPWQTRIAAALADPVWCIYLGRKNCVPSRPVWDGSHSEYADIHDALRRYPAADRADAVMQYEVQTPLPLGGSLSRSDEITGPRSFARRTVWRSSVRRDEECT